MDTEKLLKLSELKDKGAITEEEFQVMKKAILDDTSTQVNIAEGTSQKSESFSVWKIVLGFFGIIFVLGVISGINNSGKSGNTTKSHAEDDFDDEGVNADLIEMFNEKKENEYSFTQKYNNRELTFKAKVYGIKSDCYIKNIWADKQEYIPCVELAHPTKEVQIFGLATAVANARMQDESVISTLKKNQKIKLTCTLGKSTFDLVSFVFDNCRIYEKKVNVSNNTPSSVQNSSASSDLSNNLLDVAWWENATLEKVKTEIAKGVNVNEKDDTGWTPLMTAAKDMSDPHIIQTLIDAGADVNAKTIYGITPLILSALFNYNPQIAKILIENDADVLAKDYENKTALDHAKASNNVEVLKLLENHINNK